MKSRRRIVSSPDPGGYADLDELQQGVATNGMGLGVCLHSSNHKLLMSASGQKQTLHHVRPMSPLPPKADMVQYDRDVRLAPESGHRFTAASCPLFIQVEACRSK